MILQSLQETCAFEKYCGGRTDRTSNGWEWWAEGGEPSHYCRAINAIPPPSCPQPLHHTLLGLDYHSIKKNISTPSADLSPKSIVWTHNKYLQLPITFWRRKWQPICDFLKNLQQGSHGRGGGQSCVCGWGSSFIKPPWRILPRLPIKAPPPWKKMMPRRGLGEAALGWNSLTGMAPKCRLITTSAGPPWFSRCSAKTGEIWAGCKPLSSQIYSPVRGKRKRGRD